MYWRFHYNTVAADDIYILELSTYISLDFSMMEVPPDWFPLNRMVTTYYETEPWVFLMLLYHAFNLLWEGMVMGAQVRGIWTNMTTNELINSYRYSSFKDSTGAFRNPFDKGSGWDNIQDFLYGTQYLPK
jgi:hypothetical protein